RRLDRPRDVGGRIEGGNNYAHRRRVALTHRVCCSCLSVCSKHDRRLDGRGCRPLSTQIQDSVRHHVQAIETLEQLERQEQRAYDQSAQPDERCLVDREYHTALYGGILVSEAITISPQRYDGCKHHKYVHRASDHSRFRRNLQDGVVSLAGMLVRVMWKGWPVRCQ